ncbi:formate dehydrogenase accessory protein FdhE [Neobacillus sp. YX16]|uniref:formate dehydrogenase accessory protein FdhE n=1 Tax=Neobacillus sp. YX16 TaxID=3047874 RepID=UPI0024C2A554|nr:formate dehydrogenase accessory protein FdhE [Neobacillus sp. YX16]WHZ03070.1 formate dehydrogenase accessory protein FdhE [Neobacillus sp. YX16]
MMKKSVVSKEYQNLQKDFLTLQENWKKSINPESITPNLDKAPMSAGVPAAALTSINFKIPLFLQWIEEINGLLSQKNPELETKLAGISALLNEETAIRWIDEAFSFNSMYFASFAEENGLEEWIPQFLAETALRPYLQLIAEKIQHEITHAVPGAGCPVCGEPARLAVLEDEGKKVMTCPRCLAHWHAKRIECAHCGNDDHKTIQYITIEGDASSQIQVCEKCTGYIKVIDTRQYLSKPSAAMLDLNTIHLDFVAQEQGYQAVGEAKSGSALSRGDRH